MKLSEMEKRSPFEGLSIRVYVIAVGLEHTFV